MALSSMSLDTILNDVVADVRDPESVQKAFLTLQEMKDLIQSKFDEVWEKFSTSHVNFERMRQENCELKLKAARLEAEGAELQMQISRQNAKILEQQSSILALRSELFVRTGVRFQASAVDQVPAVDAEDDSDWLGLEAHDCEQGHDTAEGAAAAETSALPGLLPGLVPGLLPGLLPATCPMKRGLVERGMPLNESTSKKQRRDTMQGRHTASIDEVVHAFHACVPIFGVGGWRFKDVGCAQEFWTAVQNLAVYEPVDQKQRLKSAKKTLNALGYDVIHSHEGWPEAMSWGWDCVRAMINCYWLNTTVSLHHNVKKMLKIVNQHYKETADRMPPVPDARTDFVEHSPEETALIVNNLFAFNPVKAKTMRVEKRKMQEILVICRLLRTFRAQNKIVEVSDFRPWIHVEGGVRAALLEKLRECVSAGEQPDAP